MSSCGVPSGGKRSTAVSRFNAFLILQGLETLALRLDRISDNAVKIAQHLSLSKKVAWVQYAGLENHPEHALVKKYLSGKASGILTFGVKSAPDDARAGVGEDMVRLSVGIEHIDDLIADLDQAMAAV